MPVQLSRQTIARYKDGREIICPECNQTKSSATSCPNQAEASSAYADCPFYKIWEEPTPTVFNEAGAKRVSEALPRYSDIPPECLRALALIYNEGHARYDAPDWTFGDLHNFQLGLPVDDTVNHLMDHLMAWLGGDRSEDHLSKVAWGAITLKWYELHTNK